MARVLVTSDDRSAEVELDIDSDTANVTGRCTCAWATEPDRYNALEDAVYEASIHVDRKHRG